MAGAQRISVLAIALSTITGKHFSELTQVVEDGGALRFILTQSTPELLEQMSYRGSSIKEPDIALAQRLVNLGAVRSMTRDDVDAVEIREVPYIPSFGLVVIEYADKDPVLHVQIVAFRDRPHPAFRVSQQNDPVWHKFFADQFERYWAAAKTIQ